MKIMLIFSLLGLGCLIYFCVLGYRKILIWRLRNKLYNLVSNGNGYPVISWIDQPAFGKLFDQVVFLLTEFKSYKLIVLFQEFMSVAENTIHYYATKSTNKYGNVGQLDLFGIHTLLQNMCYSPYYKQIIPERDAVENGDSLGGGIITNIYLTPLESMPLDFLDSYHERTCENLSFIANDLWIRSKVEIFMNEYNTLLYLQSVYGDEIPFRETKKEVIAKFSNFIHIISYSVAEVEDLEFILELIDGEETLEYLPTVLKMKKEVKAMLSEKTA